MFPTEVKAKQQASMPPVNPLLTQLRVPPERSPVHHLSGCGHVTEGQLSNDFRLFNGFGDQRVP